MRRRTPPIGRVALALLATTIWSCQRDEEDSALDGDAGVGVQTEALSQGILNWYDPNGSQRGTFQTSVGSYFGDCYNLSDVGWSPLEDAWRTWTGIVTAGNSACDSNNIAGGCYYSGLASSSPYYQNEPKYSDQDAGTRHDGRDLNIAFLPTDWTRSTVDTNVALPTMTSPIVEVELESEYFWPTINWWDEIWSSAVFHQGYTPGAGSYREAWNMPTPEPGDQLTVYGLHVKDRCHANPAEIHPPEAMVWLHKVAANDYDLTFDVQSHSVRPFAGSLPNLPNTSYLFRIPDYTPDMHVEYEGDNWLVDPNSSYSSFSGFGPVRLCNDGAYLSGTPDSSFATGDPCRAQLGSNRAVSEYFYHRTSRVYSWPNIGGYVYFYINSINGTENSGGLPVLASGTYRVCRADPTTGRCAPRAPAFKQVSHGLPKTVNVNLKNYKSGLWGDFEWGDATAGRAFQQYDYTGANNQTFNFNFVLNDTSGVPVFMIQNYNGLCFQAAGVGAGQPIVQEPCSTTNWLQLFRVVPTYGNAGNFGFNIKSAIDNRCISITSGSTASGADAVLSDCVGQPDAVWSIASNSP